VKPTALLLAASLVANVAFLGVIYSNRSSDVSPANSSEKTAASGAREKSPNANSGHDSAAAATAEAAHAQALGRAFARFAEKMRAARAATNGDGKWWRRSGNGALPNEQLLQARRELSDAMIAAFGDDLGIGGVDQGRLAFLPAEKRDKLRAILEDYSELTAKFGAQGGPQLASDKEKLKLLNAERERDIAALLSPDELADYQMRTSTSAQSLINRYGDGIASEDEFKKLYALQKAFDEKFPMESFNGRVTPEAMKARSDATLQLQSDMRTAVGDDAYAALRRASDTDLKSVDALVSRLNLPADTTDRVAALRDSYATQSQKIMADSATPFAQRRDQLQALATSAKADLINTLGAEAADAYAQRSQWINFLNGGIGYSTTPTANSPGALSLNGTSGPSVYPVMPTGAGVNGARQMVNVISNTSSNTGGGTMIFSPTNGADGAVQTRVISVSSSTTGDGHGSTDGGAVTKVITTAPGDTPPTTAPTKP
jgi:hypothetical protein